VRLLVVADLAGSKHNGDSRKRDKGGQPARPITTPDCRGRGDAHLWRISGPRTTAATALLFTGRASSSIAACCSQPPRCASSCRRPSRQRRPSEIQACIRRRATVITLAEDQLDTERASGAGGIAPGSLWWGTSARIVCGGALAHGDENRLRHARSNRTIRASMVAGGWPIRAGAGGLVAIT
jgi:hypothetical protein